MNRFNFHELINNPNMSVLPYLTAGELNNLNLTSTRIRDIVKAYRLKYPPLLRVPYFLKYTSATISGLSENIVKACRVYRKQPSECNLRVDCSILVKSGRRGIMVQSNPPLNALEAINNSGVKIVLNISFGNPTHEQTTSFFIILVRMLEILKHTESIHLEFPNRGNTDWRPLQVEVDLFVSMKTALLQMQSLSSLTISGEAPWEYILTILPEVKTLKHLTIVVERTSVLNEPVYQDQIIGCLYFMKQLESLSIDSVNLNANGLIRFLKEMKQLRTFSISNVIIHSVNYEKFPVQFANALKELLLLRLSNSKIDQQDICGFLHKMLILDDVLPNLIELDISNNSITSENRDMLIQSLTKLPSLISLNISSNDLTEEDCLLINNSLPKLRLLNVFDNQGTETRMEELD